MENFANSFFYFIFTLRRDRIREGVEEQGRRKSSTGRVKKGKVLFSSVFFFVLVFDYFANAATCLRLCYFLFYYLLSFFYVFHIVFHSSLTAVSLCVFFFIILLFSTLVQEYLHLRGLLALFLFNLQHSSS